VKLSALPRAGQLVLRLSQNYTDVPRTIFTAAKNFPMDF
jgi:hypothetical protein